MVSVVCGMLCVVVCGGNDGRFIENRSENNIWYRALFLGHISVSKRPTRMKIGSIDSLYPIT